MDAPEGEKGVLDVVSPMSTPDTALQSPPNDGVASTTAHNRHPAYLCWKTMRQRCQNPNNPAYHRYGGRGIRVAERWDDFAAFVADMGPRPAGATLDRIDNDGHYEPGNVRWASRFEQGQNRCDTRRIPYDGRAQTLSQWMRELENPHRLSRSTVQSRVETGLSLLEALSFPADGRYNPHVTPAERSAAIDDYYRRLNGVLKLAIEAGNRLAS